MARVAYWVRGLIHPDSLTRIQQELISLQGVDRALWTPDAILWVKTASGDPSAYITALCHREEPRASVTRVSSALRFLSVYLWGAGLLLWLLGSLVLLPFWAESFFFAFSAAMALVPLTLGGLSLWKKQVWGTPILSVVWLILSFLFGYAAQGAITFLLYSIGSSLLTWRTRHLCRTISPVSDEEKGLAKRRADRFIQIYTVIVVALAVIIGWLVPTITQGSFTDWLYRGLSLLVLAQAGIWPLTISLHLRAGKQAAARQGAALKSTRYVEVLADTDAVALDKQGTLTQEPLFVTSLHTLPDVSANMCVGLAALLESHVDHPVARAMVEHAARVAVEPTDPNAVTDIETIPAMGVTARMADHQILCGNHHLLDRYDLVAENLPEGAVYLAIDDQVVAVFDITGPLRPDAANTISALHQQGITRVALLTGDQPTAAEKAAIQVGIEEVYAGLLPESKLSVFRKIQRKHLTTLFIGSGLYDIPTMTQADAGVSLFCAPLEVRDAADVLLTTDELVALPRAIALCRLVMKRAKRKGWIGLGVDVIAIVCGIIGILPIWGAMLVQMILAAGATVGLTPPIKK